MSRSRKKFCVDRVIPYSRKLPSALRAIEENPANEPRRVRRLPGVSAHPAKMSIETGKRWRRRTLGVRFMDGSRFQKTKVRQYAVQWSEHANIRFDFAAGRQAEIRVSFAFDPDSSWSAVGTDAFDRRSFPGDEPTMNFGWLTEDESEAGIRRVVLHEFGHALGAVHEHQVPKGGIRWNRAAAYREFSGPPNNWSREEIDFNVLDKYSVSQLNGSTFDPRSIMLYAFPPGLILGPPALRKAGTRTNSQLSVLDRRFMRRFYPR